LKSWPQAADAYRAAIASRPDFPDAKANLALVLDVMHRIEELKKDEEQEGTDQKPDDVQFDKKKGEGKSRMMDQQTLKQTSTDVWLKGLVTSPAKFLEMKFAIQAEESGAVPKK
jgi:Ca-activated chloride channel family protein